MDGVKGSSEKGAPPGRMPLPLKGGPSVTTSRADNYPKEGTVKKIAFSVSLLAAASTALATGGEKMMGSTSSPMEGWTPRKVMHEAQDKKEIQGVFKSLEDAGKKGDVEAAAALFDFPVLMATDDSKGEAKTDSWDKEKWTASMAPFYKPMPSMKMTHKTSTFFITDSLASVADTCTMTMGGKSTSSRSAMILVRKDGKWLVKSMVEGGWGDKMMNQASTEPAPSNMGTGATGTGETPQDAAPTYSQDSPQDEMPAPSQDMPQPQKDQN